MDYYQNIKQCLEYIKMLEEKKLFLKIFSLELLTGQKMLVDTHIEWKYYKFKQQYLMEIATAKALVEQQYYLNTLKDNNCPSYLLQEVA